MIILYPLTLFYVLIFLKVLTISCNHLIYLFTALSHPLECNCAERQGSNLTHHSIPSAWHVEVIKIYLWRGGRERGL